MMSDSSEKHGEPLPIFQTLAKISEGSANNKENALSKVKELEKIPTVDHRPCLEAASRSITYQPNLDTNFEDRTAFITGMAKYTEEAAHHAELNKLLDEGETYAVTLYTWRSCCRAMPTIHSNDQPNRTDIYQTFYDIMEPQVAKLAKLMRFQKRAIDTFCGDVKRLCHPERRKDFVSEDYLLTLGKLINMFAVLDALKNIKSSIRNDYSQYRRATQVIRILDPKLMEESQQVVMFLANNDEITNTLKQSITNVDHYEDLLCDIVTLCMDHFEGKRYVLPREKHVLVKVIAFGLFLMDSSKSSIYKMDNKKKISLSRADKIFKQLQVVPMYGDMQIQVFTYITKGANYTGNESSWSCDGHANVKQFNLPKRLPELREEHTEYIFEIARRGQKVAPADGKKTSRTEEETTALYQLALKGITLLSSWTSLLTELFSWKLTNPADKFTDKDMPVEAEQYERVIRYNYNDQEKVALIELIAMIKSLQLLLTRMEGVFLEAIPLTVYTEIQKFVQVSLRDPLRQVIKDKKTLASSVLRAVRVTCANWMNGLEPTDDPCLKGKKDPKDGYSIDVKSMSVGPSSTQLYLVRTMLESLVSTKSSTGRKTLRKDLDPHSVETILDFHKRSFFYKTMLNMSVVLQEACDLSQLWFREFFLEMTMGARIQFPIEMSMPWILTSHILESKDPSLTDLILYPLDLYSDSAQYALTKFKKQYLYDEIEAEVNLCFDQLLYKLSGKMFSYYKQLAGSLLLGQNFRTECKRHKITIRVPEGDRYETLLQQKHLQLLGRSIDLNRMITQRITTFIKKSLEFAVARFESSDLTKIVDFDNLLEVNRLTHALLSKHLKLPDFEELLKEVNDNVVTSCSRVTLHVFSEICLDLMPSYCYNTSTGRFIPTIKVMRSAPPKREKLPTVSPSNVFGSKALNRAYSAISSRYSGFIGAPHMKALLKLIGSEGIPLLIEELLKVLKGLLRDDIQNYVKLLIDVMSNNCKLIKYEYTTEGVIPYFSRNLEAIIQYAELQTRVLPLFQKVGNAILFFMLLERNMTVQEKLHMIRVFPLDAVTPILPFKKKEKCDRILQTIKREEPLQLGSLMEKLGTKEQSSTVQEVLEFSSSKESRDVSMFAAILERMKTYLDDPVWRGPEPTNGVMNIDECTEFHRLWSAIQFMYCLPQSETSFTPEETFGEGLQWAGCTLLTLLGQQRRFEALDFSYHVLRIHDVDQLKGDINGISMTKFPIRISHFQRLNREIFNTLNIYHDNEPSITHFSPPVFQKEESDGEIMI